MLNKSIHTPLYQQLRQWILEQIHSGALQDGDMLPGERLLSQRFTIARQTVRQTINELVLQGILYRQPGKGTYVRSQRHLVHQVHIQGVTHLVFDWRKQTTVWLGNAMTEPAPAWVASLLNLETDAPMVHFSHVQVSKDHPVNYFQSWASIDVAARLLQQPLTESSILDLFLSRCRVQVSCSQDRLEPGVARYYEAKTLQIPIGSAVQIVTGRLLTKEGNPFEAHRCVIRGDHFHLELESNLHQLPDSI